MSHSNTTPNWKIPQFSSNDVPSWLGDVNQIGQKVEQGLNAVKIIGQDANTAASGAQATANALTPRVAQNETNIEGLLTVTGSQGTAIVGLDTRVTVLEDGGGEDGWESIVLSYAGSNQNFVTNSPLCMYVNKSSGLCYVHLNYRYNTAVEVVEDTQINYSKQLFTGLDGYVVLNGTTKGTSDGKLCISVDSQLIINNNNMQISVGQVVSLATGTQIASVAYRGSFVSGCFYIPSVNWF